jgi:hypothetical protein
MSDSVTDIDLSDCTDVQLQLDWELGAFPAETHTITMNLASPGQTVPPKYAVQITTTGSDGSESTSDSDVFGFFGDFTFPPLVLTDATSYDLPDPIRRHPA